MSHRLFICCCKGFFRDENRDELYHLLDVDRRATAADLKRAFRSKSLQMHPDKLNQRGREVTDEDKANFQKMKSAYDIFLTLRLDDYIDWSFATVLTPLLAWVGLTMLAHVYKVLSDPQKREVYDQMGETGMLMMEDPFGAMDNMIKNFLTMETRDRLRLVIFVLLFVSAVLLWPILFCAKVDGDTSWSWVGIWTPLWIYDALGLWHFMYLVGLGKLKPPQGMEEDWTDPYPFPLRILALVKWVLLVIFQIFLTLRLDNDIDWTYAAVMTPLLALVTLRMIFHVYEGTRPVSSDGKEDDEDEDDEEEDDEDDEDEEEDDDDEEEDEEDDYDDDDEDEEDDDDERQQALAIRTKARLALLQDCFWMMQLVFLIIQLDNQIEWSWWVIFFPTWMVMFFQLVGFFVHIMRARKLAYLADEERLNEDDKVYIQAATDMTLNAVRSCCCCTFASITIILAVAAIAGADFSAFVVLIPLFLIASLVVVCTTCVICLMRDLPEEEDAEGDEEQGGLTGTSPLHYGATS